MSHAANMVATQDMVIHLNRKPSYLSGDNATIVSETGNPRLLTCKHLPVHAAPRRVRAGHGLLLDHRGAKVHPPLRLRRTPAADRQPAAGGAVQPVGQDNSFATDQPENELRFGKGGVDDAEDAEVILHEYGHAIHFSHNFAFASEEAGATSEGFGDYWAVTVADVSPGRWASRNASRCHAWPTGTRPPTPARRRTACDASTPTCTTRTILTARCTRTVRSGRVRCGITARHSPTSRPTRSSCKGRSTSPAPPAGPGEPDGRSRTTAIRPRRRQRRPPRLHRPRDPRLITRRQGSPTAVVSTNTVARDRPGKCGEIARVRNESARDRHRDCAADSISGRPGLRPLNILSDPVDDLSLPDAHPTLRDAGRTRGGMRVLPAHSESTSLIRQ